jgi:type IX secretion system PorP/SprF family membrane protein
MKYSNIQQLKFSSQLLGPILILLIMSINTSAQNVSFSQYKYSPFFTNPAMIASRSEMSVSILHRNQQLNNDINFRTSAITGTYAFVNKNNKRTGGVGFSALNDQQVGDDAFKLQGASIAYAYNLQLTNTQYLSFALQGGYFERKLNMDWFTTGSQWINNVGFDRSAPLGESMVEDRKSYSSISSGLNYYIEDNLERHIFSLGIAAYHLNRPVVSFYDDSDKLYHRYIANGYIALLRSDKLLFGPEILFIRQNNKNIVSPGASLSYYFANENPFSAIKNGSINLSTRYTIDNALVLGIQVNQPNFTIGFSYDFGVSTSNTLASNSNTSEILITIKKSLGRKNKSNKVVIDNYTIGEIRDFYAKDEIRYFDDTEKPNANENVDTNDTEFDWNSETKYQFELRKDFSFGFNDAELNGPAKEFLRDVIILLESNNRLFLEVVGHTDNIGTAQANKKVSLLRAQSVIDYLKTQGVNAKRLKITGKGATEPLVSNDTETNRARNRRVEFIIYTK